MMKYTLLFLFILGFSFSSEAQKNDEMSNESLNEIINEISDVVEGTMGNWQFVIDSTLFICLTDVNHNRMRIISPVIEETEVSEEEIKKCLKANFHTMLDAKYAFSEGFLWSTFIHPLKELTTDQVLSAIAQVYSGVHTFGTYYSSGILEFPNSEGREKKKKKLKRS